MRASGALFRRAANNIDPTHDASKGKVIHRKALLFARFGQPPFLAGESILEAPPAAARRRDLEIKSAAVEQANGSLPGLRMLNFGVGEPHGGNSRFLDSFRVLLPPTLPSLQPSCQPTTVDPPRRGSTGNASFSSVLLHGAGRGPSAPDSSG